MALVPRHVGHDILCLPSELGISCYFYYTKQQYSTQPKIPTADVYVFMRIKLLLGSRQV